MQTEETPNSSDKRGEESFPSKEWFFLASKLTWLIAIALVIFTTIVFKDTVFLGKPISKAYEVSKIDWFFTPSQKSAIVFCPIDPCIYFTYIPANIFYEKTLKSGCFPFWNPLVGTGYPHAASFDNAVFHPLKYVTSCLTEHGYNLIIVLKVALASIGMFGLIRTIGLSRGSAIFGSLIYSYCPFILREIEIQFEAWCYPLLVWLFISMMRRSTVWSSATIGLAAAATVASLHPTSTIYILGTSSVIGFLTVLFDTVSKEQIGRLVHVAKFFSLATIFGICFAAPFLFSFIELASNSSNYKGTFSNLGVPWQALFYLLVNPGVGGASLYLGILAAILIPLSILTPQKRCLPFTIAGVIVVLVFTTITPIHNIFELHPFNYLRPKYILPIYLLLFSLLATFGLEQVSQSDFSKSKIKSTILILAAIAVCLTPWLFRHFFIPFTGFRWDGGMPCFDVNLNAWRRDLVLVLIFISVLGIGHKFIKNKINLIAPFFCITLSAISLLNISRLTLPPNHGFYFPVVHSIKWLQEHKGRSMGLNASNLIYGLDNFNYHASYYIYRYTEFLKLCGAKSAYSNFDFSSRITPAIDAASVKYAVDRSPVLCTDDLLKPSHLVELKSNKVVPTHGVSLIKYSIEYDAYNSQILGHITWKASDKAIKHKGYQSVLLDAKGVELWSSHEKRLARCKRDGQELNSELAISIPSTVQNGTKVWASIRITDLYSKAHKEPIKCSLTSFGANIGLKEIVTKSRTNQSNNKHFKLAYEAPDQMRIYENTKALPSAYVVHDFKWANGVNEAAKKFSQSSFDPWQSVILEDPSKTLKPLVTGSEGRGKLKKEDKIERPDTNTVVIKIENESKGILVLTDAYYPGWKVKIDGKEAPLLVANCLFRAVKVPKGKHTVEFHYLPTYLLTGLSLSGFCIVLLVLKLVSDLMKERKKRRSSCS